MNILPYTIIVDIDGVLYNADPVWRELFMSMKGVHITAADISTWDFFRGKVSGADFAEIIRVGLHSDAGILSRKPYVGAAKTITNWRFRGAKIVIVSERAASTSLATRQWLDKNGIPYDELVCDLPMDKVAIIFDKRAHLVIEDKPDTIIRVLESGMSAAVVDHLYNLDLAPHPRMVRGGTWAALAVNVEKQIFPEMARRKV
jgi:uncharacterized HAD superfamily protein